jgi:hypothetical protein
MANKINNLAGERVILHYQQHKFIPSTCFGETEYFVSDVRGVQVEKSALPAPSVPQGQLQAPR